MAEESQKLNDHELLLRLDWTMTSIKTDIARYRDEAIARANAQDVVMTEMRKDIEAKLKESDRSIDAKFEKADGNHNELCDTVEDLKRWKIQVVAYGTAISFAITLLIKMFWK